MPDPRLVIDALDRADCNPRQFGQRWRAQCPVHGSRGGTLLVNENGNVHCFAGCNHLDVFQSLGIQSAQREYRPVVRKPKPQPTWRNPVTAAKRYGCAINNFGTRTYTGKCACGGHVVASPDGAVCENKCPIMEVGGFLVDWTDAGLRLGGNMMEVRTLNVLGCTEKKRGTSKAGNEWVLYQVHCEESGTPFDGELTSFNLIPNGVGEYMIERDENQFGVRYTIKKPTAIGRAVADLTIQVAKLNAQVFGTQSAVAPQAPVTVTAQTPAPQTVTTGPVQVPASEEVPF